MSGYPRRFLVNAVIDVFFGRLTLAAFEMCYRKRYPELKELILSSYAVADIDKLKCA